MADKLNVLLPASRTKCFSFSTQEAEESEVEEARDQGDVACWSSNNVTSPEHYIIFFSASCLPSTSASVSNNESMKTNTGSVWEADGGVTPKSFTLRSHLLLPAAPPVLLVWSLGVNPAHRQGDSAVAVSYDTHTHMHTRARARTHNAVVQI